MNFPAGATLAETADTFESPVFGPSAAMCRVLEDVERAAAGPGHILVRGEPGTGREMVAREIHRRGPSRSRPFVKIAYSLHSPAALELDLFGYHTSGGSGERHERRAFERIAKGSRLYQALGGTLFFANLAEIPSRIQARLARLFRDGEAVVMHERRHVGFDVRAIAAVEHDYEEALRDGRVREDLHRVMSAVRIELPPLRNRREDIPALAAFLVGGCCREARFAAKQLSEPAQQLLCALPWHGNAPELHGVLRELVQQVGGDVIGLADVLNAVELNGRPKPFATGGTLKEARARFEREFIAAVLDQHHGRVPEAARTLGIQRTNLYRKLKRLQVRPKGPKDGLKDGRA
jgi:DNA-binding NtrC family response regulator